MSHLYCTLCCSSTKLLSKSRVVCPLALVGQWADEISKMTKDIRVLKHQGPSRTIGIQLVLLCLDPTLIETVQILPLSRSTMSWLQHMTRSNLNTPHTILKPKTNPNPNRRHPRRRARQQAPTMTPTTRVSSLVPLPRKVKEKLLRRNARCLV